MNQDNSITLNQENVKNVVRFTIFEPLQAILGSFAAKLPLFGTLKCIRRYLTRFWRNHIKLFNPSKVNIQSVWKTTKMVNFDHIFDVFSVQYNWIVLPTPHTTYIRVFLKIDHLGPLLSFLDHFWACMGHFEPNNPLLVL